MTEFINFNSFNCRGLRNKTKRVNIFNWLDKSYNGITFLQETHSTEQDENIWENECSSDIYFSHGLSNKSGTAIIIPRSLNCEFEFIDALKDSEGRILLIDCLLDSIPLILINIYAPTKDNVKEQHLFFSKLKTLLDEYSDRNIIIGGDFNTCLNPSIDKRAVN